MKSHRSTLIILYQFGLTNFVSGLQCFSDSGNRGSYDGVQECLEEGRSNKVCALTQAVFYEEGSVRVGTSRSCQSTNREEGITDGKCVEKTTSVGSSSMHTLTCFCSWDLCNDSRLQTAKFRRWQRIAKKKTTEEMTSTSFLAFEALVHAFSVIVPTFVVLAMAYEGWKWWRIKKKKCAASCSDDYDVADGEKEDCCCSKIVCDCKKSD